jgi:hypothetical protein
MLRCLVAFLGLALLLGGVSVASLARERAEARAREEFTRLLEGDKTISIKSIAFFGEHGTVLVDPIVTRYLTEAFRSAKPNYDQVGVTYDVDVCLSTGAKAKCYVSLTGERGVLSVTEPVNGLVSHDPFDRYYVKLPEPIPQILLDLLPLLR